MAKELVAPVSSKGQVTLPKHVRQLLHVAVGDLVRFKPVAGGVLITRIALESEEFSEQEWKALERLARTPGRRYASAKEFLKALERL